MRAEDARELRDLREENERLKAQVAGHDHAHAILQSRLSAAEEGIEQWKQCYDAECRLRERAEAVVEAAKAAQTLGIFTTDLRNAIRQYEEGR